MSTLPPVDPNILQRNTSFAILYKDLCTRKLNPDGSTRDTKRQRIHDEIRRNLTHARTTLLQSTLLLNTLNTLPPRSPTLPQDLHHPIALLSALLSSQVPPSDREILSQSTLPTITSNIDIIASALSAQLTTLATQISKIASPLTSAGVVTTTSTSTSATLKEIETLPQTATALKTTSTSTLPSQLSTSLLTLSNTASSLLSLHLQLLTTAIGILESTKHGSLARATKSRTEVLHSRAVLQNLQARVHGYTHAAPAEFVRALRGFRDALGVRERGLRDREVVAGQALALYEKAGEKGMKDIARRKKDLNGEIRRVLVEIEKLEAGGG